LEKKGKLRENFQKFVPKRFIATQIYVLCANFVKFGRPKLGEIARSYLTRNRLALSLSLLCWSRPKSARASGKQCTQGAPNFIQIRSLPAEIQTNAWTPFKRAIKCFQYSAKLQLLPSSSPS